MCVMGKVAHVVVIVLKKGLRPFDCFHILLILEKKMTTHSRILAQRIPWTEEPGGL